MFLWFFCFSWKHNALPFYKAFLQVLKKYFPTSSHHRHYHNSRASMCNYTTFKINYPYTFLISHFSVESNDIYIVMYNLSISKVKACLTQHFITRAFQLFTNASRHIKKHYILLSDSWHSVDIYNCIFWEKDKKCCLLAYKQHRTP